LFRLQTGENLTTDFLDDDTVTLEETKDREDVISSMCIDHSVWGPVLESLPTEAKFALQTEMYRYAKANLLRVNVYLRYTVQNSRSTHPAFTQGSLHHKLRPGPKNVLD
jgi:hypothetical protein